MLRLLWLLAPLLLAAALVAAIHRLPDPLANEYRSRASEAPELRAAREATVRARISLLVVFEIFAAALLLRPWERSRRIRRLVALEFLLVPLTGLMMALAMHTGRLLALHAIVLMALAGLLVPFAILAATVRERFFPAPRVP